MHGLKWTWYVTVGVDVSLNKALLNALFLCISQLYFLTTHTHTMKHHCFVTFSCSHLKVHN